MKNTKSYSLEIPQGWKSKKSKMKFAQPNEDEPTGVTEEQMQVRLKWLDEIDDFGMTQEELNQVMDEDLTNWIEYCKSKGWDAEAIDRKIGYA